MPPELERRVPHEHDVLAQIQCDGLVLVPTERTKRRCTCSTRVPPQPRSFAPHQAYGLGHDPRVQGRPFLLPRGVLGREARPGRHQRDGMEVLTVPSVEPT
jgi:hypothetical protein